MWKVWYLECQVFYRWWNIQRRYWLYFNRDRERSKAIERLRPLDPSQWRPQLISRISEASFRTKQFRMCSHTSVVFKNSYWHLNPVAHFASPHYTNWYPTSRFVSPFVLHISQLNCSILKSNSERQPSRPRHRREENINGCPKNLSSSGYSSSGLFLRTVMFHTRQEQFWTSDSKISFSIQTVVHGTGWLNLSLHMVRATDTRT